MASPGSERSLEKQLIAASEAGNAETVSQLLDKGVDVAWQEPEEGCSALMKAAEGGHKAVVEMLLEAGCPWNLQDKDGYCAGEYAMKHPEIFAMLLDWGVQAEMVLGAAERAARQEGASTSSQASSSQAQGGYLSQKLTYTEDGTRLLDADGEAVMMGWEGPLMVRHAAIICSRGGTVLNVGFGLGLIDSAIQTHSPAQHFIIEAHPDVIAHAKKLGWGSMPGVRLCEGRWQEVVPQLIQEGVKFDGIFFDTYGEYHGDMVDFHSALPKLLKPGGIYSFFNGLAPDNTFFHLVYNRLVQVELEQLGLMTTYEKVAIKEAVDPAVWEGVNKYWHLPFYMIPTCTFGQSGSS